MPIVRPLRSLTLLVGAVTVGFMLVAAGIALAALNEEQSRPWLAVGLVLSAGSLAVAVYLAAFTYASARAIVVIDDTIRIPGLFCAHDVPVREVQQWRWEPEASSFMGTFLGLVTPEFTTTTGRTVRGRYHPCLPNRPRWQEATDALARLVPDHPAAD
jgi:uncharacterized membrane protein HdeD (DUF308 family)